VLDALETPVVLAPLGGGPSTPELAAAVCEAGGLGFLAFAYLSPQAAVARVRAVRELTSQAFGVNVFMPVPGPAEPESYSAFANSLGEWAQERGLPIGTPTFSDGRSLSSRMRRCRREISERQPVRRWAC